MAFFSDDSDEAQAYNQVCSGWEAELSNELIGAAAAYEAAKGYTAQRHPSSFANLKAQEYLAGSAGAFIDRIVETNPRLHRQAEGETRGQLRKGFHKAFTRFSPKMCPRISECVVVVKCRRM
ncbi:hypothetical protein C8F01DRAFT_1126454 [Mycena amicta]|nr:hypothetical protein C8F01DRAFT_1126454 [Mycena amicta]